MNNEALFLYSISMSIFFFSNFHSQFKVFKIDRNLDFLKKPLKAIYTSKIQNEKILIKEANITWDILYKIISIKPTIICLCVFRFKINLIQGQGHYVQPKR